MNSHLRAARIAAAALAVGVLAACGGDAATPMPASEDAAHAPLPQEPTGAGRSEATHEAAQLLGDLQDTLPALLGSGSAVRPPAERFADAMAQGQAPAEQALADLVALLMGAQLWNDLAAGKGPTRVGGMAAQPLALPARDLACGLADPAAAADGGAPALWCAAVHWRDPATAQAAGHLFRLQPVRGADGRVEAWSATGRGVAWGNGGGQWQGAERQARLVVVFNAQGLPARFALAGHLPGLLRPGAGEPVSATGLAQVQLAGNVIASGTRRSLALHADAAAAGTDADGPSAPQGLDAGPTSVALLPQAGAAATGRLGLQAGSEATFLLADDGAWLATSLRLRWTWAGPGLRAQARAAVSDFVADRSGTRRLPSTSAFEGQLEPADGAPPVAGKLLRSVSGQAGWDATRPRSERNDCAFDSRFEGRVDTAPGIAQEWRWRGQGRLGAVTWETLDAELQVKDGGLARRIYELQARVDAAGQPLETSVQEKLGGLALSLRGGERQAQLSAASGQAIGDVQLDAPATARLADGSRMALPWLD